ncbi:hypothetical protein [Bacillus benzoevorans]|uniref:Uncharacterized protein n=1 Tax=Bacillus benzoevorans TaxID=1456 RepID=A0A7X0HW34_9BACI|nr:hypothetical protein [Bacillus benzoevorans]MBB6447967.1 hypothetical protein [Bacillus benzoevorans]
MGIQVAAAALGYLLLLVLAYETNIFMNSEEERSEKIINRAYNNAFAILTFGLFIVYILVQIPLIYIDSQTTSFLLLVSKFISVLTLGGSLFILNRKGCNS